MPDAYAGDRSVCFVGVEKFYVCTLDVVCVTRLCVGTDYLLVSLFIVYSFAFVFYFLNQFIGDL